MSKAVFSPATAAIIILSCGVAVSANAAHKPYTVLWNQNSNFGMGVNSQMYESSMLVYDDDAADDFVVPGGQTWQIAEVDVTGAYVGGSGPAPSVYISITSDKHGRPWRQRRFYTLSCTDKAGSFQCVIPLKRGHPALKLSAGTYWLLVNANCASTVCGQWQWTENTTITGNEAAWDNPHGGWHSPCGGGFGPVDKCYGGPAADLAFDLIGTP